MIEWHSSTADITVIPHPLGSPEIKLASWLTADAFMQTIYTNSTVNATIVY
jgi:hypothetical protein